jgi:hypothetical protein
MIGLKGLVCDWGNVRLREKGPQFKQKNKVMVIGVVLIPIEYILGTGLYR